MPVYIKLIESLSRYLCYRVKYYGQMASEVHSIPILTRFIAYITTAVIPVSLWGMFATREDERFVSVLYSSTVSNGSMVSEDTPPKMRKYFPKTWELIS